MYHTRISRRWLQPCRIWLSCLHRPLHGIIDLQDDTFGTILTKALLIPFFHKGEGIHNVVYIFTCNAVQVKISSIKLAAEQEPPLLIPSERRVIIAEVACKRPDIPGSVDEFYNPWLYP